MNTVGMLEQLVEDDIGGLPAFSKCIIRAILCTESLHIIL